MGGKARNSATSENIGAYRASEPKGLSQTERAGPYSVKLIIKGRCTSASRIPGATRESVIAMHLASRRAKLN